MAPAEGNNVLSIFEGWENWKIALAVGAPICLGLAGLWYYQKINKSDQETGDATKTKPPLKEKVKTPASSTSVQVNRLLILLDQTYNHKRTALKNIEAECKK